MLATSTKVSEWILESSLEEKAVFIDARTKRPVVESFNYYIGSTQTSLKKTSLRPLAGAASVVRRPKTACQSNKGISCELRYDFQI